MLFRNAKTIIFILVLAVIIPLLVLELIKINYLEETYYPSEVTGTLDNPYTGWAPCADGGPYQQPHRLVYAGVTWRELEPEKGFYDFESLEKKFKFNYWESKSVDIIMRITMDIPGSEKHRDIPEWLYNEIKGDGTWYDTDHGRGFSPNYGNPVLISYHERLIKALAARYNKNPMIPVIALGSIGHWGEWHTKQSPELYIPFPGLEITDRYVLHYIDNFTEKLIIMRRPFRIAKENKFGLFNDSFGNRLQTYNYFVDYINNGYYDYLAGTRQPAMPEFWKYAPSGGEVAAPSGTDCFDNLHIESTIRQIKDCHTSWLGPSCPANQPYGSVNQGNYNLALRTMGYRFVLCSARHQRRVKAGDALLVDMEWKNKGVAPFYYRWPLELSLSGPGNKVVFSVNTPEDIRTWLPGSIKTSCSVRIPPTLPKGRYTLCVAILNPYTGKPAIQLAVGNRRPDGRYALDQVIIN